MEQALLVAHSARHISERGRQSSVGLFSSMRISGSALTAQRLRMDVIAGNIANADTTRVNGQRQAYQRQQVVFEPMVNGASESAGLQVSAIVKAHAPARHVYDPSHTRPAYV